MSQHLDNDKLQALTEASRAVDAADQRVSAARCAVSAANEEFGLAMDNLERERGTFEFAFTAWRASVASPATD